LAIVAELGPELVRAAAVVPMGAIADLAASAAIS
jgi:hypothetical protein